MVRITYLPFLKCGERGTFRKDPNNLRKNRFKGMYSCMFRIMRLDTPGLLHHIMIRGIECRKIFNDDNDRENLIERLSILGDKNSLFEIETIAERGWGVNRYLAARYWGAVRAGRQR